MDVPICHCEHLFFLRPLTMNTLLHYLETLRVFRWPPGEGIPHTLLENANYQTAWNYLFLDAGLVLLGLLWGAGLCSYLIRQDNKKDYLPLSSFLFISIGCGIALVITELFLLALFKSLKPVSVIVLFSATSVISIYSTFINRHNIKRITTTGTLKGLMSITLILVLLVAYQYGSVEDWILTDATSFHLPYASFLLENRGFSEAPEFLIYPFHAVNFSLLYALGLMANPDLSYVQTIHGLFATLTLFGIYVFCVNSGQKLFSTILLMAVFAKIYIMHTNRLMANVDLGSMYFVFCAAFTLYLWIKERAAWLLIVSGICFGIAMGTKYLMCTFALPIGIAILITEPKNWKPLAIYVATAAAFGLWWYIRNFIYTGNPVHPFATSIFGYHLWDERDVMLQFGAWEHKIPRNLKGFLFMPYYAYQDQVLRYQGAFLIISMLYASTLFGWLMNRAVNTLLLFSWIYLSSWVYGTLDPRHLLPIMPLVMVYCGFVIHALISKFTHTWPARIVTASVLLASLYYFSLGIQQQITRVYYTGVGLPIHAKDHMMRQNPTYDLISHANELLGDNAIVHEIGFRDGRWFFKGTLTGNQFGPHGYERIMNLAARPEGGVSAEKLQQLLKSRYNAQGVIVPHPPHMLFDENEFNAYFELMYRNVAGSVYRFKTHDAPQ